RPAFVFQPVAATEQRRLFAGPLLPRRLVRPGLLPVVPWIRGLRFQAVHADDVGAALQAALESDAEGPFNLAADPVVDRTVMAEIMGAATVEVPPVAARGAAALAWHARLMPSEPALLDLVLSLPLMATNRARRVLGWAPEHSSVDALRQALHAMASGRGGASAPLAADSVARRMHELRTGAGQAP
ncbi:MAG TPA: hypothetical protein VE991_04130, partial [Acidimicrobiales bacterium]|nr:hypothetical protein [Acidimicrobiales bacterium]